MKPRPLIPGAPGAGHLAPNGYWHPGAAEACPKCKAYLNRERMCRRAGAVAYVRQDGLRLRVGEDEPFLCEDCGLPLRSDPRGRVPRHYVRRHFR